VLRTPLGTHTLPVDVAYRASRHQALLDPGHDIAVATRKQITHRIGGRLIERRSQQLKGHPRIQQQAGRHDIGAGRCPVLERDTVAAQIQKRANAAVAARKNDAGILRAAVPFAEQQQPGAGALGQQHASCRGFGDPIHATTAQITLHHRHVVGHQYPAFANTDFGHARHHVVEQWFELAVMAGRIVAGTTENQYPWLGPCQRRQQKHRNRRQHHRRRMPGYRQSRRARQKPSK